MRIASILWVKVILIILLAALILFTLINGTMKGEWGNLIMGIAGFLFVMFPDEASFWVSTRRYSSKPIRYPVSWIETGGGAMLVIALFRVLF